MWSSSVCLLDSAKKFYEKKKEQDILKDAFSKEPLDSGKTEVLVTKLIRLSTKEIDVGSYYNVYTHKAHILTENNNYVVLSLPDGWGADELKERLDKGPVRMKMTVKSSSEFNGIMYNFANRGKIIE